ncbi:MAG: hypothetical protein M1839_004388 [Geoglossum umbratile]|nr:MAG: hypothetical protein M1839_004388 [Geoglossum umbratile]
MCQYEKLLFTCGDEECRLLAYCHFARNDPFHQCFGVKKFKKDNALPQKCEKCGGPKLDLPNMAAE